MESAEFILELITDVGDKMLERLREAYVTRVITTMTTSLTSITTNIIIIVVVIVVVQSSGHLHINCEI